MVKVILNTYPVIPAADEAEREALRPIGRNAERYKETLDDWHDLIRACDTMGLWGVTTIEHHFHSEGYEVSPNPGVINAYWAAITENIRIGQMGYVMSVHNPIRVAEETAILDHLTGGRIFVGLARGYQSRWTNTLGQHIGFGRHALEQGCRRSEEPRDLRRAGRNDPGRVDAGQHHAQERPVENSQPCRGYGRLVDEGLD